MVLICFGFVLTVLPIFGLRIFLLRPTAILGFKKEHSGKITSLFKNMLERARENSVKEKKWITSFFKNTPERATRNPIRDQRWINSLVNRFRSDPLLQTFPNLLLTLSIIRNNLFRPTGLEELDFLRHPSLTWAGIIWRTTILCYLSGFSMWLWWSWISEHDMNGAGSCHSSVYFFGPQILNSRFITFFRVATTILSVWLYFQTAFILPRFMFVLEDLYYTTIINLTAGEVVWDQKYQMLKERLKETFDPFGFLSPLFDQRALKNRFNRRLKSIVERDQSSRAPLAGVNNNGELS